MIGSTGMQNDIDFEAIKARVSISDVLSHYTSVPNRRKYRIACLLHNGDGPNLSVDDDKGLFHCFTCGQGGDCIALYAALENLSNAEAARILAQDYKIESRASSNLRGLVRSLKQYKIAGLELPGVLLPVSKPLTGYRRYSPEAIKHFDLRLTDDGVLIPFHDEKGRLVGYATRQINRKPKYLNSTGLSKADILYGLFLNQTVIREANEVILVEGQFDCIRVWDAGFKNVAATMGSSLSPSQARLLMPLVSKIVVLYDGDDAGRKGADEIKRKYSSLFKIQIKTLPDGIDPDTASLKDILNDH
jgi:DNA primase